MTFSFDVTSEPGEAGTAIVAARGEIDIFTAPDLKREARQAVEDGATKLVLDLSETTFLDSTGLGVIIGLAKLVRPAGGDITIVNTDPTIARTFEITGLAEILTIRGTRDEALAALAGES
jgi:anti-sigma B factor antagonist